MTIHIPDDRNWTASVVVQSHVQRVVEVIVPPQCRVADAVHKLLGDDWHMLWAQITRGPLLMKVFWYDLHGPGDVILVEGVRPLTAQDLIPIEKRLHTLGLTVVDSWNTLCCTPSLRVTGRKGGAAFTKEEELFLMGEETCDSPSYPDIPWTKTVTREDADKARLTLLDDPDLGFGDPPAMVIEKFIVKLFGRLP